MSESTKIALVTGGSRGLGKNAALSLAKKGIDVVVTYNTQQEEAENVVAEIKALGANAAALQLNVADTKGFDAFVQSLLQTLQTGWGVTNFNYLINNAGVGNHALIAQTTEEAFDNLVNIHFKGVFFLTQKLLPVLADGGRIINISSGLARFAFPGYAAYASMKGAIETFTKYLAKELGSRGIAANVVAPGAIETDFNSASFNANPQLKGMIAQQTALGRVGVADDIGGVIAFLCTEEARWINAQRIEASGGMMV